MIRAALRGILTLCFLVVGTALGQVRTGIPPFSSQSPSTFDTINEANLNIFFTIPVITKGGQGMPFQYSLVYNGSIWVGSNPSGTRVWTPTGNWGWGGASPASTGSMSYNLTQGSCYWPHNEQGHWYYWNIYNYTSYNDSDGAIHLFNHTVSAWTNSIPCGSGGPPFSYTGTVTDGSGYTITIDAGPQATVYPPSGASIYIPVWAQRPGGSISDTNGNTISINNNVNPTVFTDTLGATALSVNEPTRPAATTYTYTTPSGGQTSYTMNYSSYSVRTNFGCSGIAEYGATQQYLVSSITLPDSTSYHFTYEATAGYPSNVTGRLASVQLPTGGTIYYSYVDGAHNITCADATTATLTRTTPDGVWKFVHSEAGTNGFNWTTTITDPNLNDTVINFFEYWSGDTYEQERKAYQGSQASGALMTTVDTCYNGAAIPCVFANVALPISNKSVQVTLPGVSPSKATTTYNSNGLPTETDEYGYGPTLVRKTLTSNTGCGVTNSHILDRACSIKVYDSGSNLKAESDYSYAGSTGNLLTETRSTGGTPATLSRSFSYTANGVLQTATDFNGNTTTYSSFTCGTNSTAFPQTVTLPLSLSRATVWNCGPALPSSTTDENGKQTSYTFDNMLRLTNTGFADGGSVSTTYTSATLADIHTAVNSSTTRHDQVDLDGMGRVTTTSLVNDPDGQTYVGTTYDSLGRVLTASNPYRTTSTGGDTYAYDALNRVTRVTHADSNYASTSYGSGSQICTNGPGYPVLYTDEASKQRRTFTDALGRLIEVDEPDPANGNSLTLNTCYSYDVLGNLTGVNQGGQTRSYSYDLLSRVTSAATPESGTTHFCYTSSSSVCATPDTGTTLCSGDPNAVCRRSDALAITTTYTYDALNRLTGMAYSDGTDPKTFVYDQTSVTIGNWSSGTLTNTKGRLVEAYKPSGDTGQAASVYSYGPTGLLNSYWQCTPSNCGTSAWGTTYSYDLAGDLTSWTHPAGFTINYSPTDSPISAAQRVTKVTSSLNDSTHPGTLAQSISYTPWGALASLQNGCAGSGCTSLQETYHYDNRLQPIQVQLGIAPNDLSHYSNLTYNYSLPGGTKPPGCALDPSGSTGNNGNVIGYTFTDNNAPGLSHSAFYVYDSLNRLSCAQATGNSTYNLTFSYDRYGNMACVTNAYTNGPCPNLTYDGNNRITTSGYSYGTRGNQTSDGQHTYGYEAEGRLASVDGGATWNSTFDALGQLVEDAIPGVQSERLWNPLAGQEMGRYDAVRGTWVEQNVPLGSRLLAYYYNDNTTRFPHFNALGSTGMVTRQNGTVESDLLFYPWGQQWTSSSTWVDQYFASMGYADAAFGMYPAANRWQAPIEGRWMTPDPLAGDISNPQSLNRYAYVLNNPTTFTDPMGLQVRGPCAHSLTMPGSNGRCRDPIPGGEAGQTPWWFRGDPFSLIDIPAKGFWFRDGEWGRDDMGKAFLYAKSGDDTPQNQQPDDPHCPSVPPHPPGANLNSNIREIQTMRVLSWLSPLTAVATQQTWFVGRVYPGMSWDYKRGHQSQYADFGNFNYGATGAAMGFSLQQLQGAGGLVATLYGTHKASWGTWYQPPNYGHDPADVQTIANGYRFYQNGCH